jgi:hypothetical protein
LNEEVVGLGLWAWLIVLGGAFVLLLAFRVAFWCVLRTRKLAGRLRGPARADPEASEIELGDVAPSGVGDNFHTKLIEEQAVPRASTMPTTATGAVITREALIDFYRQYDVQRLVFVNDELGSYNAG